VRVKLFCDFDYANAATDDCAIIIIIIWLVKRQYVLKRLQWRWKIQ